MVDIDVIQLPDELDFREGRVSQRYGVVAAAGYQPLPDVLLFHQAELGLTSEELNVTLQILAHWYAPERLPFPSAKTIAKRMGCSERTVERYLTGLRRKGFLVKYPARNNRRYRGKGHDLTPLIERLKPYAQRRLEERRQRLKAKDRGVS